MFVTLSNRVAKTWRNESSVYLSDDLLTKNEYPALFKWSIKYFVMLMNKLVTFLINQMREKNGMLDFIKSKFSEKIPDLTADTVLLSTSILSFSNIISLKQSSVFSNIVRMKMEKYLSKYIKIDLFYQVNFIS